MSIPTLTKIGIAVESEWGVAEVSPAALLPVEMPSLNDPYEQVLDNGVRGIAPVLDYDAYRGAARIEGSLAGMAYPNHFGYLLYWLLGHIESAAGSDGLYDHSFSLSPTCPGFSVFVYDDIIPVVYAGVQASELSLRFNAGEGAVTWGLNMSGKSKEEESVDADWPSDDAEPPWLGWNVKAEMGGSGGVCVHITDAEFTLSREVQLKHTACTGDTRFAQRAYMGPLVLTGRMNIDYTDESWWELYRDVGTMSLVLTFSYGTAETLRQLVFTMSKLSIIEGPYEIDRSGVSANVAMSVRGLYNTTDSGLCSAVLTNDIVSYALGSGS